MHDIEDIAPKGVCSLQEEEADKTSIHPGNWPDSAGLFAEV